MLSRRQQTHFIFILTLWSHVSYMYFRVGTKDWVYLCSVASVIAMNMNLTHVHIFFNSLTSYVNVLAGTWLYIYALTSLILLLMLGCDVLYMQLRLEGPDTG